MVKMFFLVVLFLKYLKIEEEKHVLGICLLIFPILKNIYYLHALA